MEIQEAKNSLDLLPLEMWVNVLAFLDIKDSLASRLVCKDWRSVVDDNNLPKMWNPYFPKNHVADMLSFFGKKCIGTRLSSAEDVEQFMANVEGSPSNQDPFINGTLILNCNITKQYRGLFQVLPALLARFGRDIRTCVYFVHELVPESLHNILTILGLANLRYLTIYCHRWSYISISTSLMKFKDVAQTSKRLESVTVMGNQDCEFLRILSSTHGRRVKRLSCSGHDLNRDAHAPHPSGLFAFPNIEELKLFEVRCSSDLKIGRWPLKRLSLKLDVLEDSHQLGHALYKLQHLAGTLEAFHLQLEKRQWGHRAFHEDFIFPKVSDFRVSYFGGKKYVNVFARVFPNMKHFQLVDNEDLIPDSTNQKRAIGTVREPLWEAWREDEDVAADLPTTSNDIEHVDPIEEEVKPLWEKLPEGMEMISVRYRKFKDEGKVREQGFTILRYLKK